MGKIVFSKTLKKADWNNSHIINKNIVVHGSGTLTRFLIEHGLVDEIFLLVYPVVLGMGKRLFDDLKMTDLKLVGSKPFSSGVVLLRYEPKEKK